jgi:hypothetical protein
MDAIRASYNNPQKHVGQDREAVCLSVDAPACEQNRTGDTFCTARLPPRGCSLGILANLLPMFRLFYFDREGGETGDSALSSDLGERTPRRLVQPKVSEATEARG